MQKIRWIDEPVESTASDKDLPLTEGDHRGSPLPGWIRQYQPYPIFLAEGYGRTHDNYLEIGAASRHQGFDSEAEKQLFLTSPIFSVLTEGVIAESAQKPRNLTRQRDQQRSPAP